MSQETVSAANCCDIQFVQCCNASVGSDIGQPSEQEQWAFRSLVVNEEKMRPVFVFPEWCSSPSFL